MKQPWPACALLVLLFAACAVSAQTPQGGTQPPANPVDPETIKALKDMGAHLQALKRFQVTTELTGERVLADGQKLQHTASAAIDVERPNKLRARMWSARAERELVYDGKTVTLYTPAQKSYSTVSFSGNLSELVEKLQERYSIEVPLSDLFVWGTADAPVDGIESAMNAGQDFVDEDLCDHYAFRQGTLDWQIWISAAGKLPRKLVITNRADDARPQSVSLIDWNLKPVFTPSTFAFKPPSGAKLAEIVPRKTK